MLLWKACSRKGDQVECRKVCYKPQEKVGHGYEEGGSGGDKHICGAAAVFKGIPHWLSRLIR